MTALVAAAAAAVAGAAAVELVLMAGGRRRGLGIRRVAAGGRLALARKAALPVPEDLRARIAAARLGPAVDVRAVMGAKVLLAAAAGALALAPASLSSSGPAVLLLLGLPVAGFLAPDAWLAWRSRRTQAIVLAEVPDVADRLCLAVTAGLAPVRATALACRAGSGPLSGELAAAADAALAGVPLAEALGRVALRCPVPEVRSLVAALLRSQGQGTDIAPFLDDLAGAARRRQSLVLRDRAQKAGPKIQLAVALLLVPAAMALIASALASGLFSA
ncbi:MAG: type II secretion system F family protein [Solirubrobacterales bacterium]